MASIDINNNQARNVNNPYDFNGVQVIQNIILIFIYSKNHLQVHIREIKLDLELRWLQQWEVPPNRD